MVKPPRRPIQRAAVASPKATSRPIVGSSPDPRQATLFDSPIPGWIEPCLPTLVSKAPTGPKWVHEIKWDGYRVSAYLEHVTVTIRTRRGHDWTGRFPAIAAALGALPIHSAVLDGEAVVLDAQGRSDFSALQSALGKERAAAGSAVFYAFDLLFLDGHDLRPWKLEGHRDALEAIIPLEDPTILLSEEIEGDGPTILKLPVNTDLRESSRSSATRPTDPAGATSGARPSACSQISSWSSDTGNSLASLRLAEDRGGELHPVGGVGTGFSVAAARDLKRQLDPLTIPKPAIAGASGKGVVWTRPVIQVDVVYRGRTTGGNLRHPTFRGIRDD